MALTLPGCPVIEHSHVKAASVLPNYSSLAATGFMLAALPTSNEYRTLTAACILCSPNNLTCCVAPDALGILQLHAASCSICLQCWPRPPLHKQLPRPSRRLGARRLVRSKRTTEKVGHCKLVMQASLHIPALPSAVVPGATHGPLMYIYPSYIRYAKLIGWRLPTHQRACSPRAHLQGQSPPLCVCHISGRAPRCAMAAPPSPQTAPRSRTRRSRT